MKEEYKKLVEMVKKNVPDKEMMEKLGVQSKAALKKMYYDALVEAGKIKDILTEKEAKKGRIKEESQVSAREGRLLSARHCS